MRAQRDMQIQQLGETFSHDAYKSREYASSVLGSLLNVPSRTLARGCWSKLSLASTWSPLLMHVDDDCEKSGTLCGIFTYIHMGFLLVSEYLARAVICSRKLARMCKHAHVPWLQIGACCFFLEKTKHFEFKLTSKPPSE